MTADANAKQFADYLLTAWSTGLPLVTACEQVKYMTRDRPDLLDFIAWELEAQTPDSLRGIVSEANQQGVAQALRVGAP